jgi:hypothetical protein
MATLMSTSDGQGILDGYLNIKKWMAKHLSLIGFLEGALNHPSIKWLDCDEYKGKRRRFEWNPNDNIVRNSSGLKT